MREPKVFGPRPDGSSIRKRMAVPIDQDHISEEGIHFGVRVEKRADLC